MQPVCFTVYVPLLKIDHIRRIGQTKPVHVYQMIAENTVESKVGRSDA